MNGRNNENTLLLCCEIGKRIVDEAVFIYKQNRKITPDFYVCHCSMQRAMIEIKQHIEQGKGLKFICISFRDLMEQTNIYVNIEYIKTKMNL